MVAAQQASEGPRALPRAVTRLRGVVVVRELPWLVLLVVVSALVVLPLVRLESFAFEDGGAGLRRMFDLPRIWTTASRTVTLALGSVLVAVPLGTTLALAVVRIPARVRSWLHVVPLLPLVIPAVAAVTGWAFLLSPQVGYLNTLLRKLPFIDGTTGPVNVYSMPFIILITGFILTSFVYMYVYTGLRNMGREYEVAALVSGASSLRTTFSITLPLLRPSIVYATGVVLLIGLGQFTAPLLLGRRAQIDVLTTEMFRLTQSFPVDYGLGAALGTPLIFAGILLVIGQRLAIGDQKRFAVARTRSEYPNLGVSRWAAVAVVAYGLIAVVLPVLALIYVALSPFWSGSLNFNGLSLEHIRSVLFNNERTVTAISTSAKTSIAAVAIALPIGFFASLALLQASKVSRATRTAIEVVVALPLAVPTAILGFAFLFSYTRPPFELYGTTTVLVLAYVTLMIPHALRMQLAGMIALGDEYLEAARVCGAGPVRSIVRILLPLTRKGIASAATLMLVLLFHEFAASLMVRSARTQVMGTVLYDFWATGVYGEVAAMALVMIAVTTVGVFLAMAIGGRNVLDRL